MRQGFGPQRPPKFWLQACYVNGAKAKDKAIAPVAIFVGLQAPDDVLSILRVWRINGGLNLCAAAIGGVELAALWHLCCDHVWPLKKF